MRILCYILVVLFATTSAVGQQINPVPDYIFRNSMSVGRNAPTDTAAYFSVGPRYGAVKGMMPPMVIDTASMSGNKRNGLTIFSIQKNKYVYWDSIGAKWAEMAGTAGNALTSADTASLISTRAWRQKGIDSVASVRIGGSGVTGYIPKFTAARTLDSSQIFQTNGNISIGGTSAIGKLDVNGVINSSGGFFTTGRALGSGNWAFEMGQTSGTSNGVIAILNRSVTPNLWGTLTLEADTIRHNRFGFIQTQFARDIDIRTGATRIFLDSTNARVGINNTSPSYTTDISGTLRNTTSAYLATSGGNVGIATTSPTGKLTLAGSDNDFIWGNTLTTGTSGTGRILASSGAVYIQTGANSTSGSTAPLIFTSLYGGAEYMRIHANGRVTVNTGSDAGFQFDVNGTARTGTLTVNTNGQGVTINTNVRSGTFGQNIFIGNSGGSLTGTSSNESSRNTIMGVNTGIAITTGQQNSVFGNDAFNLATTASGNTVIGASSMASATTASDNVAIGISTLNSIVTNSQNVAIGRNALIFATGNNNIAIGFDAARRINAGGNNTSATSCVIIGQDARASAAGNTNEIVIGADARGNGSNTVTFGNSSTTDNYFTGALRTSAPPGGTAAAWRLGTVATVTPTSPNRTIEVSVGGTIYYIHAKTTND